MIRAVSSWVSTLIVTLFLTLPAQATEYLVGENDTLTVRVFEWMAIDGDVREWPSLTGEYVVSPLGTISLPFLGEFTVAGKSTHEISAWIGGELKNALALQDKPTASVEITRYKPIYVGGRVQAPGQYEFEPGLTVRKAVVLAGGIQRAAAGGRRAALTSAGLIRINEDRLNRLYVRRARIEAEIAGAADIGQVDGVNDTPSVRVMIADENEIMKLRADSQARQREALAREQEILRSEISTLENRQKGAERQKELAQIELEKAQELRERGLTTQAGLFDRERFFVDVENNVLEVGVALLRARLSLQRTERDLEEIADDFQSELAAERQRLDAEIAELVERQSLEQNLLSEAIEVSALEKAEVGEDGVLLVEYFIFRDVDGGSERVAANPNTILEPGDVVDLVTAASVTQ